ncbi:MAG: hypothetical protein M1820_001662 [Bogoriella megaspora]|nr:MAG: hypothetical protein M1820_001662 [Bogoriella megaspora]
MDLFNSSDFSTHVKKLMEIHHVPGLAIALVQNETIASAGYGLASIDPPKPCTADTLFDVGSCSKSMTAASVGLLVDDNVNHPEVQWKAIMSRLLPGDFVMPGDGYTENVTVEDILSHRTGMPGHDDTLMSIRAEQPDDAESVTRNLRNLPIVSPLRSKFIYNNIMYTVASYLVEKKSGLAFSDFLQRHFFQPLGMISTNLQPELARAKGLDERMALGYRWDEVCKKYYVFRITDAPEEQGATSIISSVNDYIRYVKALMNHEGPITESISKGLVESRSFEDPNAEQVGHLTSPAVYGAGLEVFYYRGYMVVNHDGKVPGFGSRHFFMPYLKFGGALFGNGDGGEVVASILARELIDAALKVPETERPDWSKIEFALEPYDYEVDNSEDLRQELCPGIKEVQLQKMPLSAYVGEYWNPGYRGMTVQVRNDKLFVDASDRSSWFTATFEHVCDQTKYLVYVSEGQTGSSSPSAFKAEFKVENDKVIKMGLHLEENLDELIWFDRVGRIEKVF